MRLLHILGELKPSGAELMYLAASDLWRSSGLECHILAIGDAPGPLAAPLQQAGFAIHHMPFQRSLAHVWRVYRFLRAQRDDVIHINGEQGCFWYALAAHLAGRQRLFRTVHNVFPFRGMLRLRRRVERRIMRALGVQMIAISPSVRACEQEHFANPTVLIPNWFDDTTYAPPTCEQRRKARQRLGIAPETVVLSTVAGCWSYKNHSTILRALTLVPKELKVMYLHAGMEEPGRPERRLAAELGLAERTRFLGIVPEVLPVLHASDAYLMPSLYEGFGCAAVEAMAAGVPAILSDVAGLQDFRALCADIRWVEPTATSVAEAMQEFACMSPEARRRIGLRLSRAAHSHYGRQRGAMAYLRLYLGDSHPGSQDAVAV